MVLFKRKALFDLIKSGVMTTSIFAFQTAQGIKPTLVGTRPLVPSAVQVSATQLIANQFPNLSSNVQC